MNPSVAAALERHRTGQRYDQNGHDVAEHDAALAHAFAEGGFHWRDGIFFKRLPDGAVRLRRFTDFNYSPTYEDAIIPPNEWASIVCSVSKEGETGARWNAAQDFHGREAEQND